VTQCVGRDAPDVTGGGGGLGGGGEGGKVMVVVVVVVVVVVMMMMMIIIIMIMIMMIMNPSHLRVHIYANNTCCSLRRQPTHDVELNRINCSSSSSSSRSSSSSSSSKMQALHACQPSDHNAGVAADGSKTVLPR